MKLQRLLLFFSLYAFVLPTRAATSYGITIGGISVTSDNYYNITGNGLSTTGQDGEISYNPTTNVLTLRGAYVDCQRHNGINISTSVKNGLRIVLEKDNYFYNINGVAININHPTNASYSNPNVYIQGSGTLTFPKGEGSITTSNQAYLCIGNGVQGGAGEGGCTINADAIYSMKDSQGKRGGYLGITDACVNLKGFSYGTVYGFAQVYNIGTDQAYSMPEGAYYDSSSQELVDANGKKVTGTVKMGWKRYGFSVGGVDVHDKNYQNVKGLSIVSGKVSYSPTSNTLTLDNATIDIRNRLVWGQCLDNYGQKLIVNVVGTCKMTRGNQSAGQDETPVVTSDENLTFQGSGSLNIENYRGYGIQMTKDKGLKLNFDYVEDFTVGGFGIDMGNGTLNMTRSSVNVSDVIGLGNLQMYNTEFGENRKIIWDPEQKVIRYHNSNNRPSNFKFVKVTQKYYVFIVGQELNDINANGFYYYNTSGTLTAEMDSSTLVINMTDFTGDGKNKMNLLQVWNNCPAKSVNLIVAGENNVLKNPSGVGLYTYKDMTIGGPGSLSIFGNVSTKNNVRLLFDTGVVFHADDISSTDNGGELWFNNNCNISLNGNSSGLPTIRGFDNVICQDISFVDPDNPNKKADLYYDTDSKVLCSGDGTQYSGPVHLTTLTQKPGDVDGDSVVDVADIANILSFMSGTAVNITLERADVNNDGKADVADIATVLSIMAGNQ
ncbi:MAG: hypothetical protein J6Z14_09340 [Prevotella sp.]|nr:hypothetical protein [Prevotella sp.]